MMAAREITPAELLALLAKKAAAPLKEANQLFVRHLQCKDSLDLSAVITGAAERYSGNHTPPLPAPSELLLPLG